MHSIWFVIQGRSINIKKLHDTSIDRYFDPCKLFEQLEKKEEKKNILNTFRTNATVNFQRLRVHIYLVGNEELFELYPHRGSSNSIDNWPRSKTFLLKLRREKQINPFQRFVKRQESTWHSYRGGEAIEPSPIPISYLRGMNFTTRSV